MTDWRERLDDCERAALAQKNMPQRTAPMLATLTDERFSSDDWSFERKHDGERCLVFRHRDRVDIYSRKRKRNIDSLAKLALLLLVVHWVDIFWQTAPAYSDPATGAHGAPVPHWLDLTTLIAVGGLWFAAFAAQLRKRPLLPVGEPHLEEALEA